MTWHPYQLNPVLSDQLYKGLVAIPDQFGSDLVFVKCFNCSLTVWQNIDISIFIAPIYILTYTCLNGVYFSLKYCCGCIDSHFLDLGTSLRWVVSFTLQPLYPRGKSTRYPLYRRLGGTQSRSRRRGEEKILAPTGTRTPTPRSSSP
jgi:hypothetical protein